MGRTKRRRSRKQNETKLILHDSTTIKLSKFMKNNGFENIPCLELANFSETGRGVLSRKTINQNGHLISVPFKLMLTLASFEQYEWEKLIPRDAIFKNKLKIHDFLSLMLVVERHKGDRSFWVDYIACLPKTASFLAFKLNSDQIDLLPLELQKLALESRRKFKESWERVEKITAKVNNCYICNKKAIHCVLNRSQFLWAYVIINTRAVYVNPNIIRRLADHKLTDILMDEPSIGLCPFLDMFNHSFKAQTEAQLVNKSNNWFYELKSLNKIQSYKQVFISYGSHDNAKLLVEYGFFIPGNVNDTLKFDDYEWVIRFSELEVEKACYKFLKEHDLTSNLEINSLGELSFNLKALFYSGISKNIKTFASIVYSDLYTDEDRAKFRSNCRKLVEYTLGVMMGSKFDYFANCLLVPGVYVDYFKDRIEFVKRILLFINKQ